MWERKEKILAERRGVLTREGPGPEHLNSAQGAGGFLVLL